MKRIWGLPLSLVCWLGLAGMEAPLSVSAAEKPAPKSDSKPEPKADSAAPIKSPAKVGPEPESPWIKDTVTLRTQSGYRPAVPEKLLFDIVWGGWGFRWVKAGQATLELLPTSTPQIIQMRSLAWGSDFFQSVYPVRDTVTSWIHVGGIYPLSFKKVLNEGSYHHRSASRYDQAAHKVIGNDTSFQISPFTHDVLSAFYFIRSQPLKVGVNMDLAAVSGKKAYNLRVRCHRRETIQVPAGTFQTLVVEPILKGDGIFKAKGTLLIWMTDDEKHLPVKMQSKIPVGSIRAELVRLP